jgi:hypothetical protein
MPNLIALCGYARTGKDEAAKALIADGYHRRCFGDIIKGQIDELVRRHLGFSAFTQDDAQKARIRHILEHWGDANYDGITREFFATLPEKCVNTRLVRLREAREWKARGGVILEVRRPGAEACSSWEAANLYKLQEAGVIDAVLNNDGGIAELHAAIRAVAKSVRVPGQPEEL